MSSNGLAMFNGLKKQTNSHTKAFLVHKSAGYQAQS